MTDYYSENFQAYFERTFGIDPSPFLEPLARRLEKESTLLDVGCGSGRDLVWMKRRGFKPVGFERSPGLVNLAREAAGCEVIEGDFESFDFSSLSVDALLLVTALVHLPHDRLPDVLENIAQALKPNGWLLLSLKEGSGSHIDSKGRTFYLWGIDELKELTKVLGFTAIDITLSPSALGTGDSIVNLLAQR